MQRKICGKRSRVSWLQNLREWFQHQGTIQSCQKQIPYSHDDFQLSIEEEQEEKEDNYVID